MRPHCLLPFILLASCTPQVAPQPTRDGVVQRTEQIAVKAGDLQGPPGGVFQPAIPAIDSGGQCFNVTGGSDGVVQRLLLFPDAVNPQRSLLLAVDATGNTQSFSDRRGDIKGTRQEASTSMSVDYLRNQATAMNMRPGRPIEVVITMPDSLMARADLQIAEMISLVRQRCF